MANNRLYIVDKETGERICLAKSMGDGWFMQPGIIERFEEWANLRDQRAAYANCWYGPTLFELVDESSEDMPCTCKAECTMLCDGACGCAKHGNPEARRLVHEAFREARLRERGKA